MYDIVCFSLLKPLRSPLLASSPLGIVGSWHLRSKSRRTAAIGPSNHLPVCTMYYVCTLLAWSPDLPCAQACIADSRINLGRSSPQL